MLKFYSFTLLFISITSMVSAKAIDSKDSITVNGKKFKFGVDFGSYLNYFNYGDLEHLEIASDYLWGGSFGFTFDWKLARIYHLRFEPYYEYQQVTNQYKGSSNTTEALFKNHIAGISFYPLSFPFPSKISPEISFGGYGNYIVLSQQNIMINDRAVNEIELDCNDIQFG